MENECKEEIDKISHHEEMNNWILNVLIQNEIADENINTDTLDCKGIEIEGRIKAIKFNLYLCLMIILIQLIAKNFCLILSDFAIYPW